MLLKTYHCFTFNSVWASEAEPTGLQQSILNDDSLTFAEKFISARAEGGEKVLHPGDITVLDADFAMAQDSTGPLAIKVFTLA